MKLLNRLMSYLLRKQGYKVIDPITQIDLSTPAFMRDPNAVARLKEKINGTQRALRILKALKGRTMDGLSNKDLCEAIDETPVNITRATAILESEGFLRKLPTGNWTLSFALLNLAVCYEQDMQAVNERFNEMRHRVATGGF